jgi:hypothetical protein
MRLKTQPIIHADPDSPLNNIDPQTWLAEILARISDHAICRLERISALELEELNWQHEHLGESAETTHLTRSDACELEVAAARCSIANDAAGSDLLLSRYNRSGRF